MRYLIALLILCCSIPLQAQRYSVHGIKPQAEPIDTITEPGFSSLFNAGEALRKSATFEYFAVGIGVISGVTLSQAGKTDANSGAIAGAGVILGILAVASELYSITLRHEAGIELKVAAGSLKLTF